MIPVFPVYNVCSDSYKIPRFCHPAFSGGLPSVYFRLCAELFPFVRFLQHFLYSRFQLLVDALQ